MISTLPLFNIIVFGNSIIYQGFYTMDSTAIMLWSVLFGGIGMGFFIYGKKQRAIIPLCTGLALFVFPYFMPNALMLVIVGIVLIAIPYFIRL